MNPTRLTRNAVSFGMACLILTGTALAGTTTVTEEVTYAREVGTKRTIYTIPAGNSIERRMTLLRSGGGPGDFFLTVSLGNSAEFDVVSPPMADDLTQSEGLPAGNATITLAAAVSDGDTSVEFFVALTASFTTFPSFSLDTSEWRVRDVSNVLGEGGTISVTVTTRDSSTGTTIDSGTDTDDWLKSAFGVAVPFALNATTATIDALNNPSNFVATPPDTTTRDNGATIGLDGSVADTLNIAGDPYTLVADDSIQLVVTGNLSGITSITWDEPGGVTIEDPVTANEITDGTKTLVIPGDSPSLDGSANVVRITVDGTTTLAERTLSIRVDLDLAGGAGGSSKNNRTLVSTATLTTWSLPEPDTIPPETTITGGPSGTITQTSVTFTFAGTDNVTMIGNLVYASRLDPLETDFSDFSSLPSRSYSDLAPGDYTFYVKARDEVGNEDPTPVSQSFTISGAGKTILIANFVNGNDATLNSRVYLWNPSISAGIVTVRVFTLPLTGETAQELTTTPLGLGTLGPRSALNIKLVEDILTPLGIPTPYTTDGGNLTLEFTILVANVRGAAQVFSSDLAFGTYPIQEIPLALAGTSTVLVANFTNGNNTAFNSRVYLWNPSPSAGNVTVRVFTLPLRGGLTQELTGTPLNLGTLEARSALNVKLAEDVLAPLGISLPYTNNDGDLTLEFTIQAPGVRGATQVFSSSLAFGTNPLQEISPASAGSPTVLAANFINGNNAAFNSSVYLFNPSASAGIVTVRVFTLPLSGGTAQELTPSPLSLGILNVDSSLNIKLVEDILTPLEIPLPYTDDGGNLTLEFTIQAADVRGAAQVFSSSFAFGVYPLQQIPSTSSGSPTVLVANFMNGNDDAFNSRVYLWNPSQSSGDVTVRVFTLPLSGGLAQELTTTPLDLGTLFGKSALNVKLAEDILTPLGITTPYFTDGGNLTLEFTIQAPDVRGAAQVFSSSFAFGTYPLQVIQ